MNFLQPQLFIQMMFFYPSFSLVIIKKLSKNKSAGIDFVIYLSNMTKYSIFLVVVLYCGLLLNFSENDALRNI